MIYIETKCPAKPPFDYPTILTLDLRIDCGKRRLMRKEEKRDKDILVTPRPLGGFFLTPFSAPGFKRKRFAIYPEF